MKKIIFLFCLLFSFDVYALTLSESEEIAAVARGIIEKGMSKEHLDSKGMPILAYMQGEARVRGYQGNLYLIKKSYNSLINVNSPKWNFDCSSFVSYIFKTTIGLQLLDSNYLGGNPYMVDNFMKDNQFYKVYNDISPQELLQIKSSLLPADLNVVIGSHVGMYVDNGEIAEASSTLIRKYGTGSNLYQGDGNYNLGTGITKIEDFVAIRGNSKYAVLRLNKDINQKINTVIKWPDTLKEQDFGVNDVKPSLVIEKPDNGYVKTLFLNVNLEPSRQIVEYAVSKDQNYQYKNALNQSSLQIEITENGSYYVSIIDINNNQYEKIVTINNIDNNPPVIDKYDYLNNLFYINAHDNESGLHDEPYSFDGGFTWTKKNTYNFDSAKTINVFIRDKLENIISKEIVVEENIVVDKKDNNISKTIILITCIIVITMMFILIISFFQRKKK